MKGCGVGGGGRWGGWEARGGLYLLKELCGASISQTSVSHRPNKH